MGMAGVGLTEGAEVNVVEQEAAAVMVVVEVVVTAVTTAALGVAGLFCRICRPDTCTAGSWRQDSASTMEDMPESYSHARRSFCKAHGL